MVEPLTPTELAEIRARCSWTGEGPWLDDEALLARVPSLLATIDALQAAIHRAAFDVGTLMETMPTGLVERVQRTLGAVDNPVH